jgi:hypothetical protein
MAQFETGYPPFRPGDNQQVYDLGCQLLDLQDRLLVKYKNKRVRAVLQRDTPRQETELFWLSFVLREIVHNTSRLTQQQQAQVLCDVVRWNRRLESLATELGL